MWAEVVGSSRFTRGAFILKENHRGGGVLVVCLVVWFLGWCVVWLVVWFLGWFVGLLNNSYLSLSFVLEGLVDGDLALFFPHPSFPTPPISLAMIRHSPSH